jgi:hypothetical protein
MAILSCRMRELCAHLLLPVVVVVEVVLQIIRVAVVVQGAYAIFPANFSSREPMPLQSAVAVGQIITAALHHLMETHQLAAASAAAVQQQMDKTVDRAAAVRAVLPLAVQEQVGREITAETAILLLQIPAVVVVVQGQWDQTLIQRQAVAAGMEQVLILQEVV